MAYNFNFYYGPYYGPSNGPATVNVAVHGGDQAARPSEIVHSNSVGLPQAPAMLTVSYGPHTQPPTQQQQQVLSGREANNTSGQPNNGNGYEANPPAGIASSQARSTSQANQNNIAQIPLHLQGQQCTRSVIAYVMVFDKNHNKLVPSMSPAGLSKVRIYHFQQSNTFRVMGRKLNCHKFIINCPILKGMNYQQSSTDFHQWSDSQFVYGLDFSSKKDAESFARAMMHALEVLRGRVAIGHLNIGNAGQTSTSQTITQMASMPQGQHRTSITMRVSQTQQQQLAPARSQISSSITHQQDQQPRSNPNTNLNMHQCPTQPPPQAEHQNGSGYIQVVSSASANSSQFQIVQQQQQPQQAAYPIESGPIRIRHVQRAAREENRSAVQVRVSQRVHVRHASSSSLQPDSVE